MHVTWTYVSNSSSACEADGRGASAPQRRWSRRAANAPNFHPNDNPTSTFSQPAGPIRNHASGYAPRWGLRPGAVQGGFLPSPPPRSRWVVSVLVTDGSRRCCFNCPSSASPTTRANEAKDRANSMPLRQHGSPGRGEKKRPDRPCGVRRRRPKPGGDAVPRPTSMHARSKEADARYAGTGRGRMYCHLV